MATELLTRRSVVRLTVAFVLAVMLPGPAMGDVSTRAGTARAADGAVAQDRVVATGQTTGYVGNFGEQADGNDDDGDLIRGRLQSFDSPASLEPATQIENTVVDTNTGLMWIRSPTLLSSTDREGVHANVRFDLVRSWQGSIDAANTLSYAGSNDWRLPNINELQTLVDFSRNSPALDTEAFPEAFDDFASPYTWSSTTNDATPVEAFYVNFYDGHAYPWHKAIQFGARPVRVVTADDPVPILKTGQRQGFRGDVGAYGAGNGDDGDLQRGLTPAYQWTDDGRIDTPAENVVLDLVTTLQWLRDPLLLDGSGGADGVGGNVDLSRATDWQSAVEGCAALAYAGYDDWHLPHIRDLVSITQPGRPGGSVDPDAFPNAPVAPTDPEIPWVWWSSTTAAVTRPGQQDGSEAWYMSTGAAIMRHHVMAEVAPPKAAPGYARCVRDAAPRTIPALYRDEVRSSADWTALTVPAGGSGVTRVGKYLIPLTSEDPSIPFRVAFQDVNANPLHYDFLRAAFPEIFGTMSFGEYTATVSPRATRTMLAGGIREFTGGLGQRMYGFDVYVDSDQDPDLLTVEETAALYDRLAGFFRRRPLVYSPTQPGAIARAADWSTDRFAIDYPTVPPGSDFEAYTTGDGYGVVRIMTLAELGHAESAGRLSFQDIVVLDRTPTDVESVVAGIVTGDRQGELSHLAVRSARRGTPNAYVTNAHAAMSVYKDQLVRLTITHNGFRVKTDISRAEAEAWWAGRRPEPVTVPPMDLAFDGLDDLAALGANDQDGAATTRVGAKAANLARLYVFLPARYQVPGFGIPFRPYVEFMEETPVLDQRTVPPVDTTLAAYVTALHQDPRFVTDSAYRAGLLGDVRDAITANGSISATTVGALAARIDEIFGATAMVRFRSSSNAEDGLVFNGAGLYDSTSVCAADSLDADTAGPSLCDPDQPNERTVERGLRRVWASLWNFRAWDERAYYGVDHLQAGMAILVTTAFPDERANGVVFTGNPLDTSASEYVVNVQTGDTSVVLPDPGVLPERDVLTVADGQVTGIRRVRASTIVTPGIPVMTDSELRELGDVMTLARDRFPVDLGDHAASDVMLDAEFKIRRGDNQLIIKQIRPFLAVESGSPRRAGALRIEVPVSQQLCATWRIAHPIRQEYDEKITLELNGGEFAVPLDAADGAPDIFGALRFGASQVLAEPAGPVGVRFEPVAGQPGNLVAHLTREYHVGQQKITVSWQAQGIRAGELNVVLVDQAYLTTGVTITGQAADDSAIQFLAPCGLANLAKERLEIELEGGQRVDLELRKGSGGGFWAGYLWADLVRAQVDIAGEQRVVVDYGHLVYDALRHNWNEQFWVLFDPPLGDAHGLALSQEFLGGNDERFTAELLDANREPLRSLAVVGAKRIREGEEVGGAAFLPRVIR